MNQPELFVPFLFSSQPCESFFRHLRSMSSTCSTIVNCSLLESIHRIKRIQLQSDISSMSSVATEQGFSFPRAKKFSSTSDVINLSLPGIEEIQQTIEKAKLEAFSDISMLGMNVDISKSQFINIKNIEIGDIIRLEEDDANDPSLYNQDRDQTSNHNSDAQSMLDNESDDFNLLEDLTVLSCIEGSLNLRGYDKNKTDIKSDSPFTIVKDGQNNEIVVRKSSICWLLNRNNCNLSSDRLQRVRECEFSKYRLMTRKTSGLSFCETREEIQIGDWCLFKNIEIKKCLIGFVLGFAYMEKKFWKAREYSSNTARIKGNKNIVGVLCHWYSVDKEECLNPEQMEIQGYIDVKQYVITISAPCMTDLNLRLSHNVFEKIKKYL